MDNIITLLAKAKNNEIAAYINGTEITVKYDNGGFFWNDPEYATIFRPYDFESIEEAEDMSCYLLNHEDEDMPFELSFAKKIKINEVI